MSENKSVMARREMCRVIFNREEQAGYFRLRLHSPFIAEHAVAGNFAHILPASSSYDPLLRRAFSIMKTEGDEFEILYRVQGKGTLLLSRAGVGEEIDILAPLGKPFDEVNGPAILVGGGVGVPPMIMLARQEINAGRANVKTLRVLIGARSAGDVLGERDFDELGIEPVVTTEDGSKGERGLVTAPLQRLLQEHASLGQTPTVYSCGPLPMLRAVAQMCAAAGARCQVSLEENMPCGVGVCNGCVVRVLGAADDYGSYQRICVDGPVVWAHQIDWDA